MAYSTKTFDDKEVLTHHHMNNIIAGIDELKQDTVNKNQLKTIRFYKEMLLFYKKIW